MLLLLFILFNRLSIDFGSELSEHNLYHTEYSLNNLDHDCLYYFPFRDGLSYEFIQYCIRSQLNRNQFDYANTMTFEDLYKQNITSEQLYEWSAPIDFIEYYQEYLESNQTTRTFFFHNCTYPWFGSHCEYRFEFAERDTDFSFEVQSALRKLAFILFGICTISNLYIL